MASNGGEFSRAMCVYLTDGVRKLRRAEAAKAKAVEARDQAEEDAAALGREESSRRTKVMAEFGEHVQEIQRQSRAIRWLKGEIVDSIEKAADGELFDPPKTMRVPASVLAGRKPESDDDDEEALEPAAVSAAA